MQQLDLLPYNNILIPDIAVIIAHNLAFVIVILPDGNGRDRVLFINESWFFSIIWLKDEAECST